jgi:hypothetical protein
LWARAGSGLTAPHKVDHEAPGRSDLRGVLAEERRPLGDWSRSIMATAGAPDSARADTHSACHLVVGFMHVQVEDEHFSLPGRQRAGPALLGGSFP